MPSRSTPPTSIGNEEYAERIANVIGEAFAEDALHRAVILSSDSLSNDSVITTKRRIEYFLPGIRNIIKFGALPVEAADWTAVAIWVPPHLHPPTPDPSTLSEPLREYVQKASEAEKLHLAGRNHWYLSLVGRDPKRHEPGAVRALFEPYLMQARQAGVPVWLEASSDHSRDVYAHFGFKVVQELIIGEGLLDRRGNFVRGGNGVAVYCMIVEP